MIPRLQQTAGLQRLREQRIPQRARAKAKVAQEAQDHVHSCLMAVLHMMMTSAPFVLPTSQANASSKDPRENGALVDIINVTRKVAIGQSRITYATIPTEGVRRAFHWCKIQMFHYLWRFLRDEGPFLVRLHRGVFQVLSIDQDGSKAVVPMITLDLTTSSGQAILWDILQSPNLLRIHLGLPCGTASLARERPVSEALRAQGAPKPAAVTFGDVPSWASKLE